MEEGETELGAVETAEDEEEEDDIESRQLGVHPSGAAVGREREWGGVRAAGLAGAVEARERRAAEAARRRAEEERKQQAKAAHADVRKKRELARRRVDAAVWREQQHARGQSRAGGLRTKSASPAKGAATATRI